MRLKENNQLKLISFLIAILLFISVNENFKNFSVLGNSDNKSTAWVTEVPLEAEYDKYNRITKKTVNETDTMQYHYNAFGQLSAVIKGGFFHEFFYDENHKPSEYTFNGKSYLKIHYDLAGNVISIDYPGEKPHQFFYDEIFNCAISVMV